MRLFPLLLSLCLLGSCKDESPSQTVSAPPLTLAAAGSGSSYAIKPDGTLWAWGDNTYGQLGNGTWDSSTRPVQVGTESNWANIAAGGGMDSFNPIHVVAIKKTGRSGSGDTT